jgi:DNA-binding transcriptional MerR regulator
MFRIGEFSRIARVSARQLRFYEEIGLFAPSHTDSHTGYRYYKIAQLADLNRILVLKEFGLSLEQIGRLLKQQLPVAELRGMLLLRRTEVEHALEEQAQRLRQIEYRIAQIESGDDIDDSNVLVREEPARRILSLRETVASFSEGIGVIGALAAMTPRAVTAGTLGAFVVMAHSPDFEPERIDAEFGFYLHKDIQEQIKLADGRVLVVRDVPAIPRLACCVRTGPPQEAHLTTARIGRFIEANGLRIVGPSREVFLQAPSIERMQDSVVEMQFPVEPA